MPTNTRLTGPPRTRFVQPSGDGDAQSRAVVYTGFQWRAIRGLLTERGASAFIERNGQEIKGRWFRAAYDETIDVMLHASSDRLTGPT